MKQLRLARGDILSVVSTESEEMPSLASASVIRVGQREGHQKGIGLKSEKPQVVSHHRPDYGQCIAFALVIL